MIVELHRQGLKVAAIARQLGIDRKTVRKYISSRSGAADLWSSAAPAEEHRSIPAVSTPTAAAFPSLTAVRLWREMRERGYGGGYTAVISAKCGHRRSRRRV